MCPCQYSPTHVKDQNPCLCVKGQFQHSRPPPLSPKSGSKTPKSDQAKCHAPFSSREHVGSIMSNMSFHDVMSRHDVMSCHVVTLETDPCVCPCQYSPTHVKDQNPCLCVKGQFQHSRPPPLSPKSGSKTPKSDQTKCHAPFSSHEHVGSIMSNMSFHDDMSRHVVMSCHVVTLETDPCVCPCQYSPTNVKDQNPCLCVKGQFQHSRPPPLSPKSGSKTPKSDQAKCHAPFSSREHVGSIMSNMSFHDDMSRHVVMSCHVVTLETDPCVCPCQYSPTHVKDQNPCLCVKGQFQHSRPPPPLSKVWLENAQIRPSKVPRPLFIPRACR